jgi:hypothetical protein
MSPCCMAPRGAGPSNPAMDQALDAVRVPADSARLSFGPRAQLATAAAWSPNPKNPPLYVDLPSKKGVPQQNVLSGPAPKNCTRSLIPTESRTPLSYIRALTRARSPSGFKTG